MAVTATPAFTQSALIGMATISTANTNRDGSGTLGTAITAGTNGTRIEHIDITAIGTVTAGVVRLYIHDGSSAKLWKEILVSATTPSTTIAAWSTAVDCSLPSNQLILPNLYSLRASTHNAESFNVLAFGGAL